MQLSLSRVMLAVGGSIFLLFLTAVGTGRFSLNELKIGSPAYQKIVASKDLVADLLPPPLFLVEAYLAVETSAVEMSDFARLKEQLNRSRRAYEERRNFWAKSPDLPNDLKSLIAGRAAQEAEAFWREVFGAYLPALERNNRSEANAARVRIGEIFSAHYKLVDREVKAANEFAQSTESAAAELDGSLNLLNISVVGLMTAILAGLFLFVKNKVTQPIAAMTSYMVNLAQGSISEPPPFRGRADEIGMMSSAVERFRAAMAGVRAAEEEAEAQRRKVAEQRNDREAGAKQYIENRDFFFKEYSSAMERLSQGDLEVRLEKPFMKDYERLRETFNTAMQRLQSAMNGVVATCGAINNSSREISRAVENLSKRNESQAATLAETASAVQQITQTVNKTADGSVEARGVVNAAEHNAVKGERIVSDAIAAMEGIKQSSEKISQIVGLIDEIAFQTNLLALNAGVEAARAGDAGKGFAVVATEVRGLAQRSAEAAKEIKALISESNSKVQDGVGLVMESGASLRSIVGQVTKLTSAVGEIAASAGAQSKGLREVNIAVQEIDRVTQENAAMAEETSAASRSLANDSATLNSLVEKFKIGEVRSSSAARGNTAVPQMKRVANIRSESAVRKEAPADGGWEEF